MNREKRLHFHKLQAAGNDFVLVDNRRGVVSGASLKGLARKLCTRRFGVGADGFLVIEPSVRSDFKMRIFNPDGSEAEMCGNGARCTVLWAFHNLGRKSENIKFDTKAGIIEAKVSPRKAISKDGYCTDVKIKISGVSDACLNKPINISGRRVRVNYINTGVPHSVVFVEGLDKINVEGIGRKIRFHKAFMPAGTNVDFLEVINDNFIKIRTYERGVEAETFACGTGVAAAAIVTSLKFQTVGRKFKIKVLTRSGEALKTYFDKNKGKIDDVWLEGKACLVYKGQFDTDYL